MFNLSVLSASSRQQLSTNAGSNKMKFLNYNITAL